MYREQEVRAGVALLDSKRLDWEGRIRLSTLDLASHFECVLGQVFGTFTNGKLALNLTDEDTDRYGFALPVPGMSPTALDGREAWYRFQQDYVRLTHTWRQVLLERHEQQDTGVVVGQLVLV